MSHNLTPLLATILFAATLAACNKTETPTANTGTTDEMIVKIGSLLYDAMEWLYGWKVKNCLAN